MAFKMTPGIKGNPAQERVQALGACGGENQPPCEPLFEKEKNEKKVQTFYKAKIKKVVAETPVASEPVASEPVKVEPVKVKPVEGGETEAVPVEGGKVIVKK